MVSVIARKHGCSYHGCSYHGCSYHVYADDIQIYVWFKPTSPASLLEAIGRIETRIVEIQQWMPCNKLRLNSAKTELMVAVSPHHQRLVEVAKPVLRIGDSVIYPRASVRSLGVIFDSRMTMHPCVNSIIRLANAHLRSLGRVRRYLDDPTAAEAARALIIGLLSRLDFRANSLLAGIPARLMNRLQVVQNNAVRLVNRTPSGAHITPVLQDLRWLPVRQRVFDKVMCLTYGSLNSTALIYLNDLVARRQHSRTLRSSADPSLLTVPRTKKEYGDRVFLGLGTQALELTSTRGSRQHRL